MRDKPLISVIMSLYNSENALRKTLRLYIILTTQRAILR